jgi:hypothetical protein
MKQAAAILAVCFLAAAPVFGKGFYGAAFYLEAGFGSGLIFGDNFLTERMDGAKSQSETELSLFPVYVDAGLGYAIFPGFLAGVLSFSSLSLVLTDFSAWDNGYAAFNSHLYAIGIRFYPLIRGIQLGFDMGMAREHEDWRISGSSGKGNYVKGFGMKFSVVYDFARRVGGSSFGLGAAALYSNYDLPERGKQGIWKGAAFLRYIFR